MNSRKASRLTAAVVNEEVWKQLRAYASTQAMVAGAGNGDVSALKRYTEFTKEWWSQRSWSWTVGTFLWLATITPLVMQWGHLDKGVKLLGLFFWLAVGGIAAAVGYAAENKSMTVREAELLAPHADLDPVQKQYVSALARLYRSSFTDEFRDELRNQLNRLMTEYDRLKAQRDSIAAMLGESELGTAIRSDIARIETKIAQSVDEPARATYRESLAIAQKRLHKYEQGAPFLERTEGQIELVAQSLAAFGESMTHVVQADRTALDGAVDGLRGRLESVREQTEAISQAFDDLQYMGR